MQKEKSDPFGDLFGLCLQLEASCPATFSNILHQTKIVKPIKFLRDISLMTRVGLGRWKLLKGESLGIYWVTGKRMTEAFQHEKFRGSTREELNQTIYIYIYRIFGCGFSNVTLEKHLSVTHSTHIWEQDATLGPMGGSKMDKHGSCPLRTHSLITLHKTHKIIQD